MADDEREAKAKWITDAIGRVADDELKKEARREGQ